MKNQERIFVIGHKNPDTDSICSAIAYADIKNRTTQNKKYIPKRAGQINEETRYVLNRFGVQLRLILEISEPRLKIWISVSVHRQTRACL